jgi:non-specific serine/threonine protein kinase
MLDTISSLHDKSLLRARESEGEPRFIMLETIREYANEKLEQRGDQESVLRQHAEYFLNFAEEAEVKLRGPEQFACLQRLDEEHDNLRAALSWALARGASDTALRIASNLWLFWDIGGHLGEGLRWTNAALDADGSRELRARGLFTAGYLRYSLGHWADSIVSLREALEILRAVDDRPWLASALCELGASLEAQGDEEGARSCALESAELARSVGDRWRYARARMLIAAFREPEETIERLLAVAEICREVGDEILLGRVQGNLGWSALQVGDYEQARHFLGESLTRARRFGEVLQVGFGLGNLGLIEVLDGNLGRAVGHLRGELEVARRYGVQNLGAEALWALAGVAAASGDATRAGRLYGAAEGTYEKLGSPPSPIDRIIEERLIRPARMDGDRAFAAGYAEGRVMSFDEAVAYGLEEESRSLQLTTVATG